jgi:hypothetical protein
MNIGGVIHELMRISKQISILTRSADHSGEIWLSPQSEILTFLRFKLISNF